MEHIVQFAVGIDDEAIKKSVMEHAEEKITKDIKQQIMDNVFDHEWSRHARDNSPLSDYSKRILEEWLSQNKDHIIEETAKYLAERLMRTKAAKEMLTEVLADNG